MRPMSQLIWVRSALAIIGLLFLGAMGTVFAQIPGAPPLDQFQCSRCKAVFPLTGANASKCPQCGTKFTHIVDESGQRLLSSEGDGTALADNPFVCCGLFLVCGGIIIALVIHSGRGMASWFVKPKRKKKRRPRRRVEYDEDDDEDDDDRPRRRRRRSRDDDDDE